MKVHNWKIMIGSVILGVAGFTYSIVKLLQGELIGIFWFALFGILMKGLLTALTKKEEPGKTPKSEAVKKAEAEQAEAERKQLADAYHSLFGIFGTFMPYGSLIIVCVAAVMLYVYPTQIWIAILIMLLAALYQKWLFNKVQNKIHEMEEK